MDIYWHGHACCRLRARDVSIVMDPCSPETGYAPGRVDAGIVTVSHSHPGHSHLEMINGRPRVVDGPGEYEIAGVVITGIQTAHDAEGGKRLGRNTVYVVELEDLVACHLGDIGHIPTDAQVAQIGEVDVLFVPVGGGATLNGAQAAQVVSLLEPKIVVPIHFATPLAKTAAEGVDKFCREMGVPVPEAVARLTLGRAATPDDTRVVVLEPRRSG